MNEVRAGATAMQPGPTAFAEHPCAQINADAIAHNLRHLRQSMTPNAQGDLPRIWAVAKADAYGHTLVRALPGLEQADGIAVLTLTAARECRKLGWRKPLLIMDSRAACAELNEPSLFPLHIIVDDERQLAELEKLAGPGELRAWLRLSGDLGHAGFDAAEYRQAFQRLQELQASGRIAEAGHLLHYASAENLAQLRHERANFQRIIAGMPGPLCTENSAALLLDPAYATQTAWVRIGLALYGISPLPGKDGADLGLKPAMELQAEIYGVRHLAAGCRLGYGGMFEAERDMRIGLVRCGYADGYPRGIGPDCPVSIHGKPSRILGKVSMDTLTVDLSQHPHAGPGDRVSLWGTDMLPIETIARSADTIGAQLCTGLTARVPRLAVAGRPL